MNAGLGTAIAFLVTAAGAALVFVTSEPADVYDMPISAAYARLTNVNFGANAHGEDALHTVKTASGNGHDVVTWAQQGDFATFSCKMHLSPLPDDLQKTKVAVNCQGGSMAAGAAEGMVHAMMRNEYIERLDATLKGRPFDKQLALGATASRWPGDGVDGSLGTAINSSVQMQGDIARLQGNPNDTAPPARADHEATPPDNAQGAEPVVTN